MNLRIVMMCALAVAVTVGCKKKEAEAPAPAPAAQPAAQAEPAKPAGPVIPEVALTGSPAENMVNVFEASVNALKGAADAKAGAALLTGMLAKYNVADIRAKSRAAKEAGEGASDELKAKYKALTEEYKTVSTKLGATDPDAFGPAAAEFAKAWGLN